MGKIYPYTKFHENWSRSLGYNTALTTEIPKITLLDSGDFNNGYLRKKNFLKLLYITSWHCVKFWHISLRKTINIRVRFLIIN